MVHGRSSTIWKVDASYVHASTLDRTIMVIVRFMLGMAHSWPYGMIYIAFGVHRDLRDGFGGCQ